MRRGEVWYLASPTAPARRTCGLVISTDVFNDRGAVYCAPILRTATTGPVPPWAVPLSEPDPVAGMVRLDRIRRFPLAAGLEQAGILTGATLARVSAVLVDLFEL